MIVRDEADCLAECLASIRELCDEMVVGDTGSTDSSQEIARSFGARVLDVPWSDDFSAARNAVLRAATGDWLLHLDADEVLDEEGARQIRELVDQDGAGCDAVELTLANYCDDPRAWRWVPASKDSPYRRHFSGYLAVPLLRLFRNGRGYEYREPVHENISASVREYGGQVGRLPVLVHHYGYDLDAYRSGAKAHRYYAIARRKLESTPDDPKALYDFAEQALACGDQETAEVACRHALHLYPDDVHTGTTLANILLQRGDFAEARQLLLQLEYSGLPHIQTALGSLAYREGRLSEARECLENVVRETPHQVLAWLYLARVYDVFHDNAGVDRCLAQVLEMAPELPECRQRVEALHLRRRGDALFAVGKIREALQYFLVVQKMDSEDPLVYNNLGVVLWQIGEAQRARTQFEYALKLVHDLKEARENMAAIGSMS